MSPGEAYALLGVSPASSEKEIKAAFRAKALKYHPDTVSADARATAHKKFQSITQAYDMLTGKGPLPYTAHAAHAAQGGGGAYYHAGPGVSTTASHGRGISPLFVAALLVVPAVVLGSRMLNVLEDRKEMIGRQNGIMNPPVNHFVDTEGRAPMASPILMRIRERMDSVFGATNR